MHVFGPVPSRRLGTSLGVDLVKHKICSLNCVYCECGATTDLTIDRKSFFPLSDIIFEIDSILVGKPYLDYITFSGSGEPTLSSDIGEVIRYIKKYYPQYKIALLTNATLLNDIALRKELLPVDLIIPSVDAGSEEVFKKINCPQVNLSLGELVNGLKAFADEFEGHVWIEVFIVPGINDDDSEIEKIKQICHLINPEKIQLNTLDRPAPHNPTITSANIESLMAMEKIFYPLKTEIIKSSNNNVLKQTNSKFTSHILLNIMDMICRRPSTTQDIASALGLRMVEVNKYLKQLKDKGILLFKDEARGRFYYIENKNSEDTR